MLASLVLTIATTIAAHPTNVGAYYPVTIVEDDAEIRGAVGTKVDGTFVLRRREAEAPREVLARFLERELRHEKSEYRVRTLRRVLGNRTRYFWHCGGYLQDGRRNAVCSLVLSSSTEPYLRAKHFPEIFDGGTSVCRVHYSFRIDAVFWLECNGEA
jgi:hypothetical protein